MDKEVRDILVRYGVPKASIDALSGELIKANCIIYKSELPPTNGEPVRWVDSTPDRDYPLRILQAYRQGCDCQWVEATGEAEPTNPLLTVMNRTNERRAVLLDKAIKMLSERG